VVPGEDESRHQDGVHLGGDGQSAAFVIQPVAQVGRAGDQLGVALAAPADWRLDQGQDQVAAFSPGQLCHMYWPVAALSVFDTRTDTTLARLMITPLWPVSRSYLAWVKTRLRRSSSA
jgi:hypothetical protein